MTDTTVLTPEQKREKMLETLKRAREIAKKQREEAERTGVPLVRKPSKPKTPQTSDVPTPEAPKADKPVKVLEPFLTVQPEAVQSPFAHNQDVRLTDDHEFLGVYYGLFVVGGPTKALVNVVKPGSTGLHGVKPFLLSDLVSAEAVSVR